jgi:hypothetical protein
MDKSFDTVFAIAMSMADTCLTNQEIEARFAKLEEEYQELIKEFSDIQAMKPLDFATHDVFVEAQQLAKDRLIKEAADCLFVLLHIGHKLGYTAKDLLHMSATKMLARLNDSNYIAKEQRG